MKKQIKCFLILATCLIVSLLISIVSIKALSTQSDGYTYIIDGANLLTNDEKANLDETLKSISNQYQMDIVVATVKSMNGSSISSYARDFYRSQQIGQNDSDDGALFLLAMNERQYYMLTNGYGTTYLEDRRDSILSKVKTYLSNGDYNGAFKTYARLVKNALASATNPTNPILRKLVYLPFCMIGGLIFAFAIMAGYKSQLHTVVSAHGASNYAETHDLNLRFQNDQLIDRVVRRTPIPRHNTSGGYGRGGGGFGGGHGPGGMSGGGGSF